MSLISNFVPIGQEEKSKTPIKVERVRLNNTSGFTYDNKSHTYTLDGMKLTSGTELISKYIKPFDSAIISEMSAKAYERQGKSLLSQARYVRQYWNLLGEHASSLGTSGHAFCKMYWLSEGTIEPISSLDFNAKKAMDAIMSKYNILEMEVPRGNKTHMIGYTIDLVMQHKLTGAITLADFKFSSKFTNEQYKDNKGKNAGLLNFPFDGFRDVAYDKGSIQLEMYKRLFEEDNKIKVDEKVLIHIDGLSREPFYGEKGYKPYIAKECSEQVELILSPLRSKKELIELL